MRRVLFPLVALVAWLMLPTSAAAQCAPEDTVDTFTELKDAIESRTTAAADGDIICVEPGTYSNAGVEITLPNRPMAADFVTVTTTGGCADSRPTSGSTTGLAYLQSTGANQEVFVTASNANWWKFECLAFGMAAGATQGSFAIVSVGGVSESNIANRAYKIHFDRVVSPILTDGEVTQFIRIAMVEDFAITRSYCGGLLGPGIDDVGVSETQCFSMNNAYCEPCLIDDNFIGPAAESVLSGGGDPAATDHNPEDITITDNEFYRDPNYVEADGTHKHFIEFKYGLNTYVARNTFTNNPVFPNDHGTAPAVFYSVRNQSGTCPGCQTHTGLVENNLMINVGQCFQVVGQDSPNTSGQTYDITFRNNVCEARPFGSCWQTNLSPDQVVISNNTCVFLHTVTDPAVHTQLNEMMLMSDPIEPVSDMLTMNNNIVPSGRYGINGTGGDDGEAGLDVYFTDWEVTGNIVYGIEEADQTFVGDWPDGQTFVTRATMEGEFIDFGAKNYCVEPTSIYFGKGADCSQIPALAGDAGVAGTKFRIRFRLASE